MSRAFVKESDAVDELPDRIVSEYPNYVTPEGLEQIEKKVAALQADLAAAQNRGERDAIASISRDLRYWDSRRSTAMVVPPPQDTSAVRFGATVTIERDDSRSLAYRIVGDDEADPAKGLLSHASPLARALIGKGVGEAVSAGQTEAQIVAIGSAASAAPS